MLRQGSEAIQIYKYSYYIYIFFLLFSCIFIRNAVIIADCKLVALSCPILYSNLLNKMG